MKKLKLKALGLGANELLTREQLRNVFGGSGSGSGGGCDGGDCPDNGCTGSTTNGCASGKSCKSKSCPKCPSYDYNYCE